MFLLFVNAAREAGGPGSSTVVDEVATGKVGIRQIVACVRVCASSNIIKQRRDCTLMSKGTCGGVSWEEKLS